MLGILMPLFDNPTSSPTLICAATMSTIISTTSSSSRRKAGAMIPVTNAGTCKAHSTAKQTY
jgi:hypothetical protein